MFMAAAPAPVDGRGRVRYPPSVKELRELHARVDRLDTATLEACAEAVGVDPEDPEPLEETRRLVHEAIDEVLGRAPSCCLDIELDRWWILSGGVSWGQKAWLYEEVMALAVSGITEVPLGSEDEAESVTAAQQLAPAVVEALITHLDHLLRSARASPAQRSRVLVAVRRSIEADEAGAAQAIAQSLRCQWITRSLWVQLGP